MKLECIGMRIREKRKEKSWSRDELAYQTDLSTIYIGMIERGEKLPRLETFLRILECLDAMPNEILRDLFPDKMNSDISRYQYKIKQLSYSEQDKVYRILDAFLGES